MSMFRVKDRTEAVGAAVMTTGLICTLLYKKDTQNHLKALWNWPSKDVWWSDKLSLLILTYISPSYHQTVFLLHSCLLLHICCFLLQLLRQKSFCSSKHHPTLFRVKEIESVLRNAVTATRLEAWGPSMGVFMVMGVPPYGWLIRDSPIKTDDLGVPPFMETHLWPEWGPVSQNESAVPPAWKVPVGDCLGFLLPWHDCKPIRSWPEDERTLFHPHCIYMFGMFPFASTCKWRTVPNQSPPVTAQDNMSHLGWRWCGFGVIQCSQGEWQSFIGKSSTLSAFPWLW